MLGDEATESLKEQRREEQAKGREVKVVGNDFLTQRTEYIFKYALETWYPIQQLQRLTPRSVFLEVTDSELKALYSACQKYKKNVYRSEEEEVSFLDGLELKSEEEELLKGLSTRIDESIEAYFASGKVFVKLSTRSPKDALTDEVNDQFKMYLNPELDQNANLPLDKDSLESKNLDSISFCIAKRKCMKIKSGSEALNILILSSRVREDLMKSYDCNWKFPLKIILREWFDFKPEQEFRIFVKDSILTAITQYCYFQYFPIVSSSKPLLQEAIKQFYNKEVKPFLLEEHKNCVIDICVVWNEVKNDSKEGGNKIEGIEKIFIIEINPFFSDTSGCLFNWRSGADGLILRGQAEFEMRVVEKIQQAPLSCYSPDWVDYINGYRGRAVRDRGSEICEDEEMEEPVQEEKSVFWQL